MVNPYHFTVQKSSGAQNASQTRNLRFHSRSSLYVYGLIVICYTLINLINELDIYIEIKLTVSRLCKMCQNE